MRNRTVLERTAAISVCAALVAQASSGQLTELKSTRYGDGSLSFGARSSMERVGKVTVWIQERGVIGITLAEGVKDTFEGEWRQQGDRRITFTVTKMGRDPATGSGELELDGRGSFGLLALSGRARGSSFSFRFIAGERDDIEDFTLVNRTEHGSGTMTWGSRSSSSNVKTVRVWMTADHRVQIDPSPGSNDLMAGHWWRVSDRHVSLDIDRVNGRSATGSGTIVLDGRGSFSHVDVSGRSAGASFDLEFRVGGGPSTQSLSDRERREFVRAAQEAVKREFSTSTRLEFWGDSVGGLAFGQRNVTGSVRARGGNRPGTYAYTAVVRAGTKTVKSVTVKRS
jgi:hypothetical protein